MSRRVTREKKFATEFDTPTHFRLVDQNISIGIDYANIYPQGKTLYFQRSFYGANNVFISKTLLELPNVEPKTGLYHFLLQNNMPANTVFLDAEIVDDISRVIVSKRFDVEQGCNDKAFGFHWINSLGGFDYYAFDGGFTERNARTNATYQSEYAQRNLITANINSQKEIRITQNNVPASKIKGIDSMMKSRQVWYDDFYGYYKEFRVLERDALIPVSIKPNSVIIQETAKSVFTVEFEVIFSLINS